MRAIAIVDGEHYPDVVRAALAELPYEFVAVRLVGGTEKLRGEPDYGVPIVADVPDVDVAIDLTDERRTDLIADFLAAGISVVGADFRFDPPPLHEFELPSISVIGTGKRVGKTAVSAHVARLLARDRDVVCVAMGRGGPAEPELVDGAADGGGPARRARAPGSMPRRTTSRSPCSPECPTVGCRRAGGGMAGAPFVSNVARRRTPGGVARAGRRRLRRQRRDDSADRVDCAHLIAHDLAPRAVSASGQRPRAPGRVDFSLRLEPAGPLHGRVAVFTAGPAETDHLEADVVHVSHNLARRDLLREELERVDADTYLVELKAAAIDVVAEHADARGARIVLAGNDVVSEGLDERILELVPARVRA